MPKLGILATVAAAALLTMSATAATKKALPKAGGAKHAEFAKPCAAKWPAYLAGLMRVADDAEEPMTPAEIKQNQTGYMEYCQRVGPNDSNIDFIVNY